MFDRERLQPAIRKSICTGEQTAGFLDKETGKFREDRLLRTAKDRRQFCSDWGIEEGEIREVF